MPVGMPENVVKPSPTPVPGKGLAVQRLFAAIAKRYDFANHLLSGGLDFLWRRRAANIVRQWNPSTVLDLATGSGDLAHSIGKICPNAKIVGADFCLPMLQIARRKRVRHLVQADGLHLPFRTGVFDVVSIAFGLRNMESWPAALGEMARVLRRGGHLLVLDFSIPQGRLKRFYRFYLHRLLPGVAAAVTGEKSAYEYLADSIEAFPSGTAMNGLIESAGFSSAQCELLTGGIVSVYTAAKS
jgi:demethylmenaquinone methyltransferase/2-methoxy-6-polyprenyl-1,4-benzoquinol methylase